jgi:hypothetical protein
MQNKSEAQSFKQTNPPKSTGDLDGYALRARAPVAYLLPLPQHLHSGPHLQSAPHVQAEGLSVRQAQLFLGLLASLVVCFDMSIR